MLVACWSVKGGSGTTVVATALAVLLARSSATGALLVDLAGDVPSVVGVPDEPALGVRDWLAAPHDVDPGALSRLEVAVSDGLALLPVGRDLLDPVALAGVGAGGSAPTPDDSWLPGSTFGAGLFSVDRERTFARAIAADPRPVVVDCGSTLSTSAPWGLALAVTQAATVSLLVLRPCYLAVRRALRAPISPSGIVLVHEAGRSLQRSDLESVLRVPVRAVVELDPAVARAVDAGVLASRLPRSLSRALRHAA